MKRIKRPIDKENVGHMHHDLWERVFNYLDLCAEEIEKLQEYMQPINDNEEVVKRANEAMARLNKPKSQILVDREFLELIAGSDNDYVKERAKKYLDN